MKTFIFLILITVTAYSQWTTVNVSSSGKRFNDVCVVNDNVTWALLLDSVNNVYKTTNNGANWVLSGSLSKKPSSSFITAVDANTAWVTASTFPPHYWIYKTTDGGTVWTQQTYSPESYINYIKFFDQNTGFFVADQLNDTVGYFYTRNGGLNWVRSPNAPLMPSSGIITENQVGVLDTNFIWFCAKANSSQYKFYTLTGGLNNPWVLYDYNYPGSYSNAIFRNALTGLVANSLRVLMTTNGGANWTIRNNRAFGTVFEFLYVPGTDWVVYCTSDMIAVSYDFCQTWNDSMSYSYPWRGDAKSSISTWVAGSNGQLLHLDYASIGIEPPGGEIPTQFVLYQNYPNPFNPATEIRYALPKAADVTISVYTLLGEEVMTLVKDEYQHAGNYRITVDASSLASGVYVYQMNAGTFTDSKKMVLIK